jgi:hypothetical protein
MDTHDPDRLLIQAGAIWPLLPAEEGLVQASRRLLAYGLPYELVLIPSRGQRANLPGGRRPAFTCDRGGRIRQAEALASDDDVVLTPNRFAFYEQHGLLWQAEGFAREAPVRLLEAGFRIAEQSGGALLVNSIGASASICQAHGHLVRARSEVLAGLPMSPLGAERGLKLLASDPRAGHPALAIQVRGGSASDRARLVRALLDLRTSASYHVLAQEDAAWVMPRRREIVEEVSPYAIGAAEFFGRFVLPDRETYDRLDRSSIELALAEASLPATDEEFTALQQLLPELFERAL